MQAAGVAAAAAAPAPAGPVAVGASLAAALADVDPPLGSVIQSIADSVAEISSALRSMDFGKAGSTNSFGDDQLQADLHADDVIFKHLRGCGAVASASSEERSDVLPMGGRGYTVAFDPLDGSSIFGANFAVGSIFGVWPGDTPLGQTGRQQAAAAYSIYGPRTLLVVAVPVRGGGEQRQQQQQQGQQQQEGQQQQQEEEDADGKQQRAGQCRGPAQRASPSDAFDVLEFALSERGWVLRAAHESLAGRNSVAPANIRAAAGNDAYQRLIASWIAGGCKLRYSGGMVPDVHHMLAKGGGVFCNPRSASAPAKLRLLYECAPVALVVEAAGGVSHDGEGSILDLPIEDTGARTIIALGSRPQVEQCLEALRAA